VATQIVRNLAPSVFVLSIWAFDAHELQTGARSK